MYTFYLFLIQDSITIHPTYKYILYKIQIINKYYNSDYDYFLKNNSFY